MEQIPLLAAAINLTLFGMGFVFLFLAILVIVTRLMSVILQKSNNTQLEDELDEETKSIIEQAIKIHRGA